LGKIARARAENQYSRQAWTRNLLAFYSKFTPSAPEHLKKLDEVGHA
jgi:hypothetical protein